MFVLFVSLLEFEMPDKAHMATRKKILESILRDIHVLYPCKLHNIIYERDRSAYHVQPACTLSK